jgi:hypothetical protein
MRFLSSVARRCAGFGALLGACMVPAQAAPPAAPTVTSAADIKVLSFDWDDVPGAGNYEFWFRPSAGGSFVRFSSPTASRATNSISAHLLDWQGARYRVKACNSSGCTESPQIAVGDLFGGSLGYFKAGLSRTGAAFGVATALSEDGRTLAVVANGEPGAAPQNGSVAVYVFSKSGSTWRQQARLVPNPSNLDNGETPSVTLSGDGNVLALGLLADDPVGPAPTSKSGAAYVFRRSGTTWNQEQRVARPATAAFFGYIVKLDEAGSTLLVADASFGGSGSIYRRANGAWPLADSVPGPAGGTVCEALTLSGDGRTVTRVCRWPEGSDFRLEFFSAPDWIRSDDIQLTGYQAQTQFLQLAVSYDANVVLAAASPRGPESTQFPQAEILDRARGVRNTLVPIWPCLDPWVSAYGSRIALSRDGRFAAVSDPADQCTEQGSVAHANDKGSVATGAVYVYGLSSAGTWPLRRTLKRNGNAALPANFPFGGELAFGVNGGALAISQPSDRGGANGIDGNRNSTSKPASGAVWLY